VPADAEAYELVVAGPAARAIADELPEAVAGAVIDLITGPLVENPDRLGRQLRNELTGIWSARRGTFRVLYRIDEVAREVIALRVDHRGSAYRLHWTTSAIVLVSDTSRPLTRTFTSGEGGI